MPGHGWVYTSMSRFLASHILYVTSFLLLLPILTGIRDIVSVTELVPSLRVLAKQTLCESDRKIDAL